jgi:ferredoxin-type protein NapF
VRATQSPWPAQLSIQSNCLAQNEIYCQSCRDACEFEAIEFAFTHSSIPKPSIKAQDCTQCGACIASCPQNAIELTLDDHNGNRINCEK